MLTWLKKLLAPKLPKPKTLDADLGLGVLASRIITAKDDRHFAVVKLIAPNVQGYKEPYLEMVFAAAPSYTIRWSAHPELLRQFTGAFIDFNYIVNHLPKEVSNGNG